MPDCPADALPRRVATAVVSVGCARQAHAGGVLRSVSVVARVPPPLGVILTAISPDFALYLSVDC